VLLLRHAEAGDAHGGDPELTETGRARAAALADLLEHAGVSRLYASEYRRTQATLEPLAARLGLTAEVVPAGEAQAQLERLRALPPGSLAVVAGHSNTLPALVRGLGGAVSGTRVTEHGEAIDPASYDRLFVVVLGATPGGFELRYGP
jgi:phosphohistidine phosphatase SixA